MKKTIIIFGLFVFLVTKNNAQTEWAPIGAKWSNERNDLWWDILYYTTFKSVKDTLVSNKNCRKIDINEFVNNRGNHTKYSRYRGYYIMYNDSDKVFYQQNNKFWLLYDFSLKKGDTLFSYQPIQDDTAISLNKYIIDSIKTLQISGKQLRSQYLHTIDPSFYEKQDYYFFVKGSIIERIGYTGYLFGNKIELMDSPGPYFKCYEDNDVFYKASNKYNCDGLNDINDNNKPETIELYPNPVFDNIIIYCTIRRPLKLQVYNAVGQSVLQRELNNLINSIDISSLTKGIYILKITSLNGTIEKKIIKE